MQYLLLIYHNEKQWETKTPAELGKIYQDYGVFTKGITDAGNYKGGNPLEPTSKATTVRVRDNKKLITDGPFAETKEQLGGYYLVEAKDLDEALAIAANIPAAAYGSIEVRPIMPMTRMQPN